MRHKGESEIGRQNKRVPARSFERKLTIASDDFDKPNGIAFSPDESVLYVADTGRLAYAERTRITSAPSTSSARKKLAAGRRRRLDFRLDLLTTGESTLRRAA